MVCIDSNALLESVRVAFGVMSDSPELNMSNYDHDDVALLNTAMCEAWSILNEELAKYEPDSNVTHEPCDKRL